MKRTTLYKSMYLEIQKVSTGFKYEKPEYRLYILGELDCKQYKKDISGLLALGQYWLDSRGIKDEFIKSQNELDVINSSRA